jgi:hypothetical protein
MQRSVLIAAAGLATLLLVVGFAGPDAAWGLDSLRGRPAAALLFGAAAVVLLVPAGARRIGAVLARLPDPARPRGAVLLGVLLAAAGLALAFAAPSAVPLLGDGQLHLGDLQRAAEQDLAWSGVSWANDNAPLSYLLLHTLHRARPGASPESTFVLLGAAGWVLTVILAVLLARQIGRTPAARGVALAFLLSGGALQLFCGYAEIYALIPPALLGFLAAGVTELRARRPPIGSAILLGLLMPLHFSLVSLLPAVVVAAAGGRRPGKGTAWGKVVAAPLVCLVVTAGALLAIGWDGPRASAGGASLLPWITEPTFRQAYRALAPAHFLDLANLLLLVAPAVVVALPVVLRRAPEGNAETGDVERAVGRFLLAAAIFPLAFVFLVNPEVGMFRDWDVLAFAGWPLGAWAAWEIGRRVPAARLAAVAVPAAGIALLASLAWVTRNADAELATERFARLLESAPLSEHGKAYGWESIGGWWAAAGETAAAAGAYDRATAAAPDNARLFVTAARLRLQLGQEDAARERLQQAMALGTHDWRALMALAALLERVDPEEAARVRQRAEAARNLPSIQRGSDAKR